jgi:hypothetical protein
MLYSRHCDIFKARDGQYYCRLETAAHSEEFEVYGPFGTAASALGYLQREHGIQDKFYLDETGRRPEPATAIAVVDAGL